MANPIDTVFGYLNSLTNKRDAVAVSRAMESVYPRNKVVNITSATQSVNELQHGLGRMVTLNRAAGIAVTLPASTGLGMKFRFFIGTTVTSNSTTIKVANASDIMSGVAIQAADGGATSNAWETGASDDTITFNGSTTGGIKGDYIELEDVALNVWSVRLRGAATGAEATPFSATVS